MKSKLLRGHIFIIVSTFLLGIIIYLELYELSSFLKTKVLYGLSIMICIIYVANFFVGRNIGIKIGKVQKTTNKQIIVFLLWLLLPPICLAALGIWSNTTIFTPIIISYISGGFVGSILGATRKYEQR